MDVNGSPVFAIRIAAKNVGLYEECMQIILSIVDPDMISLTQRVWDKAWGLNVDGCNEKNGMNEISFLIW